MSVAMATVRILFIGSAWRRPLQSPETQQPGLALAGRTGL
ncbi:hypothetical protein JOF56_001086 [Kibdelosporangium banguiense]|uniref:Uncharacterized protein n=1 Tax=Kibdelosporangium banguiense TaxID=1365924 RepID=A0ABS4T8E7_9PSEU|nr:hypothetical protein [Kibdelosporangium banguiense]